LSGKKLGDRATPNPTGSAQSQVATTPENTLPGEECDKEAPLSTVQIVIQECIMSFIALKLVAWRTQPRSEGSRER